MLQQCRPFLIIQCVVCGSNGPCPVSNIDNFWNWPLAFHSFSGERDRKAQSGIKARAGEVLRSAWLTRTDRGISYRVGNGDSGFNSENGKKLNINWTVARHSHAWLLLNYLPFPLLNHSHSEQMIRGNTRVKREMWRISIKTELNYIHWV